MRRVTRRRRVLTTAVAAGLLAVGYLGTTALRFRYATGRHVTDRESLEEAWALFNPFRAREPERMANDLLAALVRGECQQALVALAFSESDQRYLCANEEAIPMHRFTLIGRKDTASGASFVFRTYLSLAGNPRQFQAYASVQAERRDGNWSVTKYFRVRDPLSR